MASKKKTEPKKEPVKKEVVKKEPVSISKPDRLYYDNIIQAERYFREQELIALEKKDKEAYEKRKKEIERKEKAILRLKAYKEKKKITFLTYAEYLSLQASSKLPGNYRIMLLRPHGGKGNLHWR